MNASITVLFIGDIIGEPGFNHTQTFLPALTAKHKPDFVIANGENITDGMGIIERDALKLLSLNINVLTGGNHTMDKIQAHKFINDTRNLLRPANYPRGVYGNGYGIYKVGNTNHKIAIINLMGRVFMKPIECPFKTFDWIYDKVKNETNIIFVDFHAEATAEKMAFGWHCDGRASVVVGTHTHLQTADNRVLPNGTAYITDVGMTGPYDSVIGMKKEASIKRFMFATPQKHEVAQNDLHLAGVLCKIDTVTGRGISIERIFYPEF
ncbi:MAG: TIGR00282 family metallophosphoesterase [Ignavibacteria bacterium]|nr:TIGR00282 family metallophosphoesterase [Ignavibacteria bacterium]